MSKSTCSVDGCGKPAVYGNGWCGMHYQRWQRHGSLDDPKPPRCAVDGCTLVVKARGLCGMHYMRWRRHGDPEVRTYLRGDGVEDRFWAHVDKNGPVPDIGRCWVWTGKPNRSGYGTLVGDNKGPGLKAHRFAYSTLVEEIPEGLDIDHICRNRACVNPRHLRAVTPLGNASNAVSHWSGQETCPRGHPYDSFRQNGARRCTVCEAVARKNSA